VEPNQIKTLYCTLLGAFLLHSTFVHSSPSSYLLVFSLGYLAFSLVLVDISLPASSFSFPRQNFLLSRRRIPATAGWDKLSIIQPIIGQLQLYCGSTPKSQTDIILPPTAVQSPTPRRSGITIQTHPHSHSDVDSSPKLPNCLSISLSTQNSYLPTTPTSQLRLNAYVPFKTTHSISTFHHVSPTPLASRHKTPGSPYFLLCPPLLYDMYLFPASVPSFVQLSCNYSKPSIPGHGHTYIHRVLLYQ